MIDLSTWKVCIWGHKFRDNYYHTHCHIHDAWYRAFTNVGANVCWFDDQDDVSGYDFHNTLFITEWQACNKMPLRDDAFYIVHNRDERFKELSAKNRCMGTQTYTDDALSYTVEKIAEGEYFDLAGRMLYMMWATDLLPHEIASPYSIKKESNIVNWVGTIGGSTFGNIKELEPFMKACSERGKEFKHYTSGPGRLTDIATNVRLIRESYIAPTIVGTWQHEKGYVPCRIFKNISYGKLPGTNSPRVKALFDSWGFDIVHNNDTHQLFYDMEADQNKKDVKELWRLIDFVRDNHTYLNRMKLFIDCANRVMEGK